MTEQNEDVSKEEIEHLKELLRTSTAHISLHNPKKDVPSKRKRSGNVDGNGNENGSNSNNDQKKDVLPVEQEKKDHNGNRTDDMTDTSSKVQYTTDETELILPSRKKKNPKRKTVELTPEELKAAKAKHKAMQRKLNQIQDRQQRKKKRTELYATLSEHALSEIEMQLMEKSAELGKKVSKKDTLRKLLQKERAGIALTVEEKDVLYTNVERDEEAYEEQFGSHATGMDVGTNDMDDGDEVIPLAFSSTRKKKKRKEMKDVPMQENDKDDEQESTLLKSKDETPKLSFAAQMMAGLSTLKTSAAKQKEDLDMQQAKEQAELEEKKRREEEEAQKKRKVYVPQNPVILKSAAMMGITSKESAVGKDAWRVLPVQRPAEVNAKRYDLPVNSMEYEIIDSIRNNSVTIICSETGSGKSTQVPQFLYESGVTLGNAKSRGEDDGLLICITQPRRVAAVSTAKRVCYEMGHSRDKGQSIQGNKGEGNVVAYQTKYETAGLGPKTRVKFMTDGILLQEIKSDLLLRKYAGE